METFLDDQAFTPTATTAILADVLAQAREQAARDGRVIASILCDGIDISNEDMDARLAEPADAVDRIDFKTSQPEELVGDALNQALGLLEETDQQREQVVEWLTQGEGQRANEGLVGCFQNWSRIHTAIIQSIAMLDLDVETLQVNGEGIDTVLAEITNQLQQIKEVLLAGDQVLLADLLQYEFEQATNRWKGAIEAILGQPQSPSATWPS